MRFTKAIALAIFAATSRAIPATNVTILRDANANANASAESSNSTVVPMAQGWAQFCSDTECNEDCGISVAIDNDNCLHQVGRKSVKLHGTFSLGPKALIASPGDTCDCQSSCMDQIPGEHGHCINLEDYPAHSFRFIHGSCPEDDC